MPPKPPKPPKVVLDDKPLQLASRLASPPDRADQRAGVSVRAVVMLGGGGGIGVVVSVVAFPGHVRGFGWTLRSMAPAAAVYALPFDKDLAAMPLTAAAPSSQRAAVFRVLNTGPVCMAMRICMARDMLLCCQFILKLIDHIFFARIG